MDKRNFQYKAFNGLLDINTLSPDGRSYYKLLKPTEINFGNYGTEIIFYDFEDVPIYHRNMVFAHQLKTESGQIEFVRWSLDGSLGYFFEYSRDEVYDDVFFDVTLKRCYRIRNIGGKIQNENWLNKRDAFLNNIPSKTKMNIIQEVTVFDASSEEPHLDEIKGQGVVQSLFKRPKIWYP